MNPLILLIEDAPDQVHIMSAFIRTELPHAKIVSVGSVKEAIAEFENKTPQLIILDLTLTDGSGEDVLKHIRAAKKDLPVLVATGDKSEETLSKLFDLGADDYVVKPIDDLIFQSKVRSLLSGKYMSPLQFLGKRDGLGSLDVTMDMKLTYLDEFSATFVTSFQFLPGAQFEITVEELSFKCKVMQSQAVDGSGIHLDCEVDSKSIADRAAFRKFLLNKNSVPAKGAA